MISLRQLIYHEAVQLMLLTAAAEHGDCDV